MKIPYSVWALEDSHLVNSDIQKYKNFSYPPAMLPLNSAVNVADVPAALSGPPSVLPGMPG